MWTVQIYCEPSFLRANKLNIKFIIIKIIPFWKRYISNMKPLNIHKMNLRKWDEIVEWWIIEMKCLTTREITFSNRAKKIQDLSCSSFGQLKLSGSAAYIYVYKYNYTVIVLVSNQPQPEQSLKSAQLSQWDLENRRKTFGPKITIK